MTICKRCEQLRPGINAQSGLCSSCIQPLEPDWHLAQAIKKNAASKRKLEENAKAASSDYSICQRCAGLGFIAKYHHIDKGVCFSCRGLGHVLRGNGPSASDPKSFASLFEGAQPQPTMSPPPPPPVLSQPAPQVLIPPPPPPPMLDKQRVVDAALDDNLSYVQLRSVLDNANRYGFTVEERELLEDCMHRLVPGVPTIGVVHSGGDWWSRDR